MNKNSERGRFQHAVMLMATDISELSKHFGRSVHPDEMMDLCGNLARLFRDLRTRLYLLSQVRVQARSTLSAPASPSSAASDLDQLDGSPAALSAAAVPTTLGDTPLLVAEDGSDGHGERDDDETVDQVTSLPPQPRQRRGSGAYATDLTDSETMMRLTREHLAAIK